MLNEGFLNTRAPLIIDLIAVSLVLVILLQVLSLVLVRSKRYLAHKRIQVAVGSVMGILILAFEIQMRLVGWRHLAEDSPYFDDYLYPALLLHLIFAIPTFLLWIFTIVGALRNFPTSPRPSKYSMIHRRLGKISVVLTFGTCFSAYLFYWLAFAS